MSQEPFHPMTLRVKPVRRVRRSLWAGEDRQRFWVTLGFVALIVVALLVLGGTVAARYYDEHFKAIAKVGDAQITRDHLLDRARALSFRLDEAIKRTREAIARGDVDGTFGQQQISQLQQQQGVVGDTAIGSLIDEAFQNRLAPALQVSVSDADVQAELDREATTAERRNVLAIVVEPEVGDDGLSSEVQKQEARDLADDALGELNGGADWAAVAQKYSTDASKSRGGDYGAVTADDQSEDRAWLDALFQLPLNGTTGVVQGSDGAYRIGRVTAITPAVKDESFLARVDEEVGRGPYSALVRADVLRRKLEQAIVAQATTSPQEQVHAFEIFLEQPTGGGDGGPQVRASHILFSPNDDSQGASELPDDDPAWAVAEGEANAAAEELRAVSAPEERAFEFETRAQTESDDAGSGSRGGDLGWFDRATMVEPFANAVFDGEHAKHEIIGPVKSEFGYHVIMYVGNRPALQDRLTQLKEALAKPDADFEQLAKEQSDGANAQEGGEIGWVARHQQPKEVEDALFALQAGQTTPEPIQGDDGYRFYHVKGRMQRELTTEQRDALEASAFSNWYEPQRTAAQNDGTIYLDPTYGSFTEQ
jgi:parvulin-like peptidyl-prolyl isomerase